MTAVHLSMRARNSGARKFLFSDALTEVATYVFVRKDSRIKMLSNEDIAGSTLCRTSIRPSQELDQGDRNWLKGRKGNARSAPNTIEECFRLLDSGTVDGVVEAELVARASMNALGMADRVQSIEPPVALSRASMSWSRSRIRTHGPFSITSILLWPSFATAASMNGSVVRHLARFWGAQTKASAELAARLTSKTLSPASTPGLAPTPPDASAVATPRASAT